MCDNTAPYTAQEVHLVTTKFKIVDKYTVEYFTVLTQAQSFLKQFKNNGIVLRLKQTCLAHTRKNILI